MNINEVGVSSDSIRYVFTPSSFAERIFYYPTRIGHYYCNRNYHFNYQNDIAVQPGHLFNYMILLVKRGQMNFIIEDEQRTVSKQQIVIFDCQQAYEYYALSDDLEFYWLLFNGGQSELFYRQIIDTYGGHVFHSGAAGQIETLFTRLIAISQTAQWSAERIYSEKIYALLCQILVSEYSQDDPFTVEIDKAMIYMDENFEQMLSVEAVASYVGLSSSYFTKQFRLRTGYTPYEYLTLQRIHKAKELLVFTNKTVQQIGYDVGYNSEDNFIKSFKKKVGVSPNSYRKFPI